jgi:DNA-binding response OmpR family regulator
MKKKILVIEDDRGILDALKLTLEYAGYEVTLTDKGDYVEKLRFIEEDELPQVIILDILLSGKDGRVICKKLKSEPQTKHIPIIMVSAHPKADVSAKQAGANDFLAKPFNIQDLLTVVKKYTN